MCSSLFPSFNDVHVHVYRHFSDNRCVIWLTSKYPRLLLIGSVFTCHYETMNYVFIIPVFVFVSVIVVKPWINFLLQSPCVKFIIFLNLLCIVKRKIFFCKSEWRPCFWRRKTGISERGTRFSKRRPFFQKGTRFPEKWSSLNQVPLLRNRVLNLGSRAPLSGNQAPHSGNRVTQLAKY